VAGQTELRKSKYRERERERERVEASVASFFQEAWVVVRPRT
jgi:hypothetical protein